MRECFQNALPIGQRLLPAFFLLCQNSLAPKIFCTYALCGGCSGLCQNGSRKFFCLAGKIGYADTCKSKQKGGEARGNEY